MPSFEQLLLDVDIPTLTAARGLIQVVLAALIVWMGVHGLAANGARWWALGILLNGFALLAFIVSGDSDGSLSVVINHLSFGFSSACMLIGFWRFGSRPINLWLVLIIIAIPVASLSLWEFLYPSARYRILTSASGQVVYLLALQYLLSRPPHVDLSGIYRALRLIVIAYCILLIWAYAGATQLLPITSRVAPGYHGTVFSIGSMLFMLALSVSFLALQFSRIASENAEQARRDWLTRLLNRRGFFAAASPLISSDQRVISALVVDVDHFKSVNDSHGHLVGDAVLVELARLLRAKAPENSVIGRLGGVEFAVLIPDCDLSKAIDSAQQLRRTCTNTEVVCAEGRSRFSISIGVAQAQPGETLQGLIARADAALFDAKRGGRNRVAWTEAEDEELAEKSP